MKKQNNNGKVSITYPFPEEITIKPGITLKISVSDDFPKDKVVTLDIKTKCVEAESELEKVDDDTIPGHPNCHFGECDDCHVVSCSIYQGYETVPTRDDPIPHDTMAINRGEVPGHPNCKRSECATCHVVSCNERL